MARRRLRSAESQDQTPATTIGLQSASSAMYHQGDTIAAVASASGAGARAIVRVSGPRAREIVEAVFQPADGRLLGDIAGPSRLAGRVQMPMAFGGTAHAPADLLFWPGARSYTREPLAELHTLGAEPLAAATLRAVFAAGARPAEPGEFTLRAFLAGRIDLAQAEAVLGVIDAAGQADLDAALGQLAGGLTAPLHQARERLLDLLAHLEAGLDFVDEDIEFITFAELAERLGEAIEHVSMVESQMADQALVRDAPRVVLYGRPNVGKSSLFNALCRADAALVADQAGTTRDYVTASLDLAGCRCELVDTAGVLDRLAAGSRSGACEAGHDGSDSRDAPSPDVAAQRRMATQRAAGELGLLCLDATRPLDAWERDEQRAAADRVIVVLTKQDALADGSGPDDSTGERPAGGEMAAQFAGQRAGDRASRGASILGAGESSSVIATSALTGAGVDGLRLEIGRRLADIARREGRAVLATAERARGSLAAARQSLTAALAMHHSRAGEELVAAETRAALDALGQVTGAVAAADILDRVFSRFCIGK